MRIFLSYPSELKSTAEPIAFSLRSRGHKVFLDRDDLPPGLSYDEQIQKAIEQSDVLIYLICPASVEKGRYTLTEMEFARAAWGHPDSRVLPVLIEPTDLSKVPSFLKGVTILNPQGNVTAEVAAAADKLRGSDYQIKSAIIASAICGLGGIVSYSMHEFYFNDEEIIPGFSGILPNISSVAGLGIPFSLALWFLRKRSSYIFLLPAVTVPMALSLGLFIIKSDEMIPQVDYFNLSDYAGAVSTSETNVTTEEQSQRVEQLNRIRKFGERANFSFEMAIVSSILTIGLLVGSINAAPELSSTGRWLKSIFGIATSIGIFAWFVHPMHTGLFSDWLNWSFCLLMWCFVAGGFLGYWIGRGQPT